ncbi:hypothetical protein SRHO_G00252030 [Serrasalmus rhombeus]
MESVKVPNSLIIKGLSETEVDNEVFEYLKQYGKFSRIIKVPDASDQVIVEFESGLAVETLKGSLPFDRICDGNTDVVHHIDALANVYSSEKGTGLTESFITQLREIAKHSEKPFETLLQDELARIADLVAHTKPVAESELVQILDDEPAEQTPSDTDPENEEYPKTAESHSTQNEHTPEPTKTITPDISRPEPLPQFKPRGLVGNKSTANVKVNGIECNSLLDTGSQVTTVSQSFYDSHLSNHPIHPISDILEVEGANGQAVPYLGYIQLSMQFPREFMASQPEVQTLALIVPDTRLNSSVPVLIGTNTLDPLYEQFCDGNPLVSNTYCGYQQVLKTLQLRQKQNSEGQIGVVRLGRHEQGIIPARQKVVLEGFVSRSEANNEKWAVLEEPSISSLPGGIFIDSCLISIPARHPYKIPVVLRNETSHDIVLPSNSVLAELCIPHEISQTYNTYSLSQLSSSSIVCSSQQQPRRDEQQTNSLSFDFGDSPLPAKWKKRITETLNTYSEVFSQYDLDFGHATKVKHRIKLKDETPFKHRPRPIHPKDYDAVRRHLQTLLEAGIIHESESPYASPIVIVKKKNGDVRLCVDYRRLNMQTIKDAYALPNLEESFSALSGSQWFSVMDLKSRYYQIEMHEDDKPKTAFVCPLGFWEWNCMPQGITNAPSTFQRLMEKCMGDIHLHEVLVFLDDSIVFSQTLEEHEARLTKVLDRLRENGLKLSPDKCRFFQTSVRYLGHIVSQKGVETDPQKIEALKTWLRPRTLKELRSFLGFSGYYRRFVQDYSKIVKPLTNLTAGYPPARKSTQKTKTDAKYFHPKEPFGERWTTACQNAFERIIERLTSSPVLGFANPELPYVLHTDASTTGLGAALYQEQDGQKCVIAYASRGLSQSEARYSAHKLEFLALKWAVVDKFQDYLYGHSFTVVTDNNPLRYILTMAKLDATSYRWLAALSTYSFDIQYRAGKQNQDADGLSRRPHGPLVNDNCSQEESQQIHQFTSHHLTPVDVVKATCQYHAAVNEESPSHCLVESLAIHPDAILPVYEDVESELQGLCSVPTHSEGEIARLQREDPSISVIIKALESGEPAPQPDVQSPELMLMLRGMSRLEVKNSLLYRKRQCEDRTEYQLVLPRVLRPSVLTSLHDEMVHLGIERTLELARSRFYWLKMSADVESKVKTCPRCVKRKHQPEKAAPMVSIQTSRPMELVCMDFLSLEPDSHNTKDILVITDHFTKYAVAIPTKDQKAITVARCLWEQFFIHYGFPEHLHSDQGRDFDSQIVKELCALVGTKKVRTSPYYPRGNPVERYNCTLLSMLGTLREREKTKWREYVKPLTHAYNCTKNEVTGYSPYELMFGRQPRLPIDIAFGLPVKGASSTSHSQYVKNLKSYLKESYNIAIKNAKKVADKNKKRFDMRKRAGELPVYTVCPAGQDEPTRTLHRDLLLPCGFLAEEDAEPEQPVRVSRPRTRQSTLLKTLSDEEDYSLSYPLRFEVETRIIGPEVMYPTEKTPDVAQPGNEPSPPTHSSTIPENLPEITPKVQCSDIPSSSMAEEEPDLIQFPPDDPVDAEPVEKELPSNQSNMNAEPESSVEPKETKPTENDQEEPITLSEPKLTTTLSQEQNDTVVSEVVPTEKTDKETPLLDLSDLPVIPNTDTSYPTVTHPCPESSPVEGPDSFKFPFGVLSDQLCKCGVFEDQKLRFVEYFFCLNRLGQVFEMDLDFAEDSWTTLDGEPPTHSSVILFYVIAHGISAWVAMVHSKSSEDKLVQAVEELTLIV